MTENELITSQSEHMQKLFKALSRAIDGIENLAKTHKPILNGERFLTDREVSARLKISRRTLQDHRDQGRIPFHHLGGKILYKESDIERMLDENYRAAFEKY